MSSSTHSSPTPRSRRQGSRRVSFNLGRGASLFTPENPAAGKPRNFHSRTPSGPFRPSNEDRRTRVEDASDSDSDSDRMPTARRQATPAPVSKTLPQSKVDVNGVPLPTTNATAAAIGINPAVGANPVFTHHNNGFPAYGQQLPYGAIPCQSGFVGQPGFAPGQAGFMAAPHGAMPVSYATHLAAGSDPASTGVTFVPAVPDATNGPMVHTYIPRNDMPMTVAGQNGLVYMQQPGTGYAANSPCYQTAPAMSLPVPVATGGIATTTAPMMPYMAAQQPGMMQPAMVPPGMVQPAFMQQASMGSGGYTSGMVGGTPPFMMMPGGPSMPGNYGAGAGIHPEPALGVGQTPTEVVQEQLEFAHANNLYEPQDFKPADDDKSRFYWVRELDGNWTQRNRATVDRIGCRWYLTESGVFYAVRLPN